MKTDDVTVRFLESSTQQKHEEDCTEEDAERAHGGNHDLCHHLHVADQRICKTPTVSYRVNPDSF